MPETPALPLSTRALGAWFAAVVVGCFVVFSANLRELGLADTVPATLLAASIVRDFDLSLDEYQRLLDERAPDGYVTLRQQMEWTRAIRFERGHLRSSYPIGAAIYAAPVFAIPVALGTLHHFWDYRAVGKVAASLITALSAGLVLLCLLRFAEPRIALFLTVVYALGTDVWVVASQSLWQHGPALLSLSLATWGALRLSESGRRVDALLVSFGCGMAIVCRPQNAVSSAVIGLFALASCPRRAAELLAPAALIGALLVWYDLHAFGTLSGGYEAVYQAPAHAFRHLTPATALTMPLKEGLAGILLSPSRGLFVYSPVLAVALVALAVAAVTNRLARYLVAWVVVTLIIYGKNRLWWGGTSYGPRYLTELSLPLVLGLGMVSGRIWRHRAATAAVVALSVLGIGVQALGAFTWECGWHHFPTWIDFRPDRLWDVRDPEIGRCMRNLVTRGPTPPEFSIFKPQKRRARR